MATVTTPIMTDATGQSIDSKLNSLLGKMDNLAAAFQPNASGIVYSNTTSGLTGDDVQEAIDEMAADVSEIKQSLSDKATRNWTMLGTVTATGSLTLSHVVTDYAEVLICLQYPYPISRKIRQSLVAPIEDFINELLFPDFTIASVRCYFGYTYTDSTHINVTSYEKGTLSGVGFTIYGR